MFDEFIIRIDDFLETKYMKNVRKDYSKYTLCDNTILYDSAKLVDDIRDCSVIDLGRYTSIVPFSRTQLPGCTTGVVLLSNKGEIRILSGIDSNPVISHLPEINEIATSESQAFFVAKDGRVFNTFEVIQSGDEQVKEILHREFDAQRLAVNPTVYELINVGKVRRFLAYQCRYGSLQSFVALKREGFIQAWIICPINISSEIKFFSRQYQHHEAIIDLNLVGYCVDFVSESGFYRYEINEDRIKLLYEFSSGKPVPLFETFTNGEIRVSNSMTKSARGH